LPLRAQAGVLAPLLVIGLPALERQLDDHELAFALARQLADLRSDRYARLLCPRAGELAQIVDAALADPASHSHRWLAGALRAVELDQVLAIVARLRERGPHDATRLALGWLAATDRAADRIGLVVAGDLAACVRVLERDGDPARVTDLVAASVSEPVLTVRGRVEHWPAR
jgi:hypothetical protein